jgi:hypothetical protein
MSVHPSRWALPVGGKCPNTASKGGTLAGQWIKAEKQQNRKFERRSRSTARAPCFAVLSSLSIPKLAAERDDVTQGHKNKREQRLVKALRDNLRRRKQALREPAKAAGEAAEHRALNTESKPTS